MSYGQRRGGALLFLLILFPYGKPLPGRAFISVEPHITHKTVARRASTNYSGTFVQCPVQSSNVPEHSLNVPEHSLNVPEHSLNVPEHSLNVPVHSLNVPEHSLNAPEHSVNVPEHSMISPGE
jgi:hypothetical protein